MVESYTWTQGRQLTQAFTTSGTEDVTIAYTYDADGLRTSKTVVTGAHTHNYTSTVVAPTCTAQGYTSHECCCGNSYVSNYLNALGHKFTDKLGRPVGYCTRCGASSIILPPAPTEPGPEIMSAEAPASTAAETSIPNTVTEYEYIYAGTKLVRMVVTTTVDEGTSAVQTLDFAYDASGMPVTFTTGGSTYYYTTNLQGDVMALLNSTGTAVAQYSYDPYGNVITATGDLAALNPLTYRGYVYDRETALYYLQSRYYDPELGRFINADVFASTGQGILGNNMFAYCNNNPIKYSDPYGYVLLEAILMVVIPICIDATIDGALSALVEYITGGNSKDIGKEFVKGFGTSTVIGVVGIATPADEMDDYLKAYAILTGVHSYFDCVNNGASHEEGLFVAVLTSLTNLPYTVVDDATARKVAELIFGIGSDAGTAALAKYYTGAYSPQPKPTIDMIRTLSTQTKNQMAGGCASSAAMYSAFHY